MSNFLELCQSLREEAGISGADGTPASVVGQTGEMKRVVNWIKKAGIWIRAPPPAIASTNPASPAAAASPSRTGRSVKPPPP